MGESVYWGIKSVIDRLRRCGREGDAARLDEAVRSAVTGSAIFTAVRWHLDRIRTEGQVQDAELLQALTALQDDLDQLLRG